MGGEVALFVQFLGKERYSRKCLSTRVFGERPLLFRPTGSELNRKKLLQLCESVEKPEMNVPNQWEQQYPYSLHTTNRITGFNEQNCNLNFNINSRLIYYRNISNDTQLPIFPDEKKAFKTDIIGPFFFFFFFFLF